MNIKATTCVLALIALSACKADDVEIDITAETMQSVLAGETKTVEFEAAFSALAELGDEERSQIAQMEDILDQYMEIFDFDLESTDFGFEITIEGEMPISTDPRVKDPYFVLVTPDANRQGWTKVSLETGGNFQSLESGMEGVNFMLAPDQFHPTSFSLRGDAPLKIMAPAVQVDGKPHILWEGNWENRTRLNFQGGIFDEVGAGFFVLTD